MASSEGKVSSTNYHIRKCLLKFRRGVAHYITLLYLPSDFTDACHEPRRDKSHKCPSFFNHGCNLSDLFCRIPSIIRWHLHDTNFEAIQRIQRNRGSEDLSLSVQSQLAGFFFTSTASAGFFSRRQAPCSNVFFFEREYIPLSQS